MDRETVITQLRVIHTWAEFAREYDLQFFTAKHLEDIAQWTDDALALLKEQEEEIEDLKQTCQSMMEGAYLLKEQEAATVISIHRNGFGSRVGACPNCQSVLHYEYNQSFCGKCGQAVKWE